MRTLFVALALLAASAAQAESYVYIDVEHISSVLSGPPPSFRRDESETEVNVAALGWASHFDNGAFVDAKLAWQIGPANRSELEGADPFLFIRFGWRIKTWN